MTCARCIRAAALVALIEGRITAEAATAVYLFTKEHEMSTITPHLIGDALAASLRTVQPAEGWECDLAFEHVDGDLVATLWHEHAEVETRRFRLVEVTS